MQPRAAGAKTALASTVTVKNALDLAVDCSGCCRVCVLSRIHCRRNFFGMLGHYFTPLLDVGFDLGTAFLHRLLAAHHILAKLFLAGIDIVVDLCRGFPRLLLQIFCALASALGQTLPSLCSRLGSIKHTDCRANSQPD